MSNIIPGFTPLAIADFTQYNTGSSTFEDTSGGINWTGISGGANQVIVQTAPSTPWKATSYIRNCGDWVHSIRYGMCFRQSSNGYFTWFGMVSGTAGTLVTSRGQWVNWLANYVTSSGSAVVNMTYHPHWFQLEDDGTNRNFKVSTDGVNWTTLYSISRTTFLTADQVGFAIYPYDQNMFISIDHFKLEAG